MNRHQQRLQLMTAIYQYRLLDKDLNEVADDIQTADPEINAYYYDVLAAIDAHEPDLITRIDGLLVDWDFDRLGYVEQAILLLAAIEIDYLKYDKGIVIDEAVRLAKTYCDDEAYRLINGVLDRI